MRLLRDPAQPLTPRQRVDYSAIVDRPPLRWPGGARLALWVVPNIEHYEYVPLKNQSREPWPLRMPHPDITEYSIRDYGNRVGIWRLAEILDEFNVKCTVSLNVAVVQHFPEIAELIRSHQWAVMGHGIYNSRYVTDYSEEQEREEYQAAIEIVRRHTGITMGGMFGPGSSGTIRTPDLIAEAGLIYQAEWVHDDQPVEIRVRSGRLASVPYSYELNDGLLFQPGASFTGPDFVAMCRAQFDRLYEEGSESGRVMCVSLHPFRAGQPHMRPYLREIFSYICGHDDVWYATGEQIAEYYLDNYVQQLTP